AVSGSGVNIKLIEYMDAAIPLVSTSLATRGLPLVAGTDLEIHDDAPAFGAAVLKLLRDPEAARAMSKEGQTHIREILDAELNLDRIAEILSR
ncbi:MAG: polysaccharide biosynthesis protein PslH, partial [Actinomycetota bacterium]|nr:polysaccharide biosynthesis protein PslH [Actinomycetota bacterium]